MGIIHWAQVFVEAMFRTVVSKSKPVFARGFATQTASQSNRAKYLLAAGAAAVAGFGYVYGPSLFANDALEAPHFPWSHHHHFNALDHKGIRRGWQVYREVCSACHSINLVYWRHLIGVVGTEDEVKEWASEYEYLDGPNDDGEMEMRAGKTTDRLPLVYANETEARIANGGALPPDLSLMVKARHHGDNYVFSLLTGYRDAPHGLNIREGLHYNPYFPGSAIGMTQALWADMVEYEDGTEASISQMAKDVTTFLCWTAEPEHDDRKKLGWKCLLLTGMMLIPALYWKRFKFSVVKTRQIKFNKLPERFY